MTTPSASASTGTCTIGTLRIARSPTQSSWATRSLLTSVRSGTTSWRVTSIGWRAVADSTSCVCGHAYRDHGVADSDGAPCYSQGCDCENFSEFSYKVPAPRAPVNSELASQIVGVLFKHDPMM